LIPFIPVKAFSASDFAEWFQTVKRKARLAYMECAEYSKKNA
jgi:hypothetical protein